MGIRRRDDVRAKLGELLVKIEDWRKQGRRRGRRMPEELWREAMRFGREHGVHIVARTLRLDYYSLKRRMVRTRPAADRRPGPAFVEVAIGQMMTSPTWSVEVVRSDGTRLTVQTSTAPDLCALTAAFVAAGR